MERMVFESEDIAHDFEKKNVFGLQSLDVPIYRVFKKFWLTETIQRKQLTLQRPAKWHDPFENYLRSRRVVFYGQSVTIEGFTRRLYGQCWSLCEESDAMWRIYSPYKESDGVKVKTTARKLFNVLLNIKQTDAALRYFIGKVDYLEEDELERYFSDADIFKAHLMDATGTGPVVALLKKRKEFEHEKEVRLLYQDAGGEPNGDRKLFPIDPNELFEELVFDPRISEVACAQWKAEFTALGFTNPMHQSGFYRLGINKPLILD
ncbi:MAG TPA: DUF2971 domain-containing protein [Phycisphaerae bacterium]|nr:DUF2971 domain-containing protein [Phycisphaerae bacterium]